MNTITYHKAGIDDVSNIVDNRILFALELSGPNSEAVVHALRQGLSAYFLKATLNNSCISFIAKVDNEVAGIGSVHVREMPGNFKNPSGKWGYIMNMYTVPNHRRKGICKGILNHLVEEGKKIGITAFELHATTEGEMVYKQTGFSIHNEPTYRLFVK
jgi:predicted acetyltransferase